MGVLKVHKYAGEDLNELEQINIDWWAEIKTLLQELQDNSELREALSTYDYGDRPDDQFDVTPVEHHQKHGENIWRLKIWDEDDHLIPYRILYAVDYLKQRYIAFGVLHRDICYDRNHEKIQRILAAYERLGIPKL